MSAAAGSVRPSEDEEPTVETLGPDWAALRAFGGFTAAVVTAVTTGRLTAGPYAAIVAGLLVLAAAFVAAHVKYARERQLRAASTTRRPAAAVRAVEPDRTAYAPPGRSTNRAAVAR